MALSNTERAILDEIKTDTKESREASIRTEAIVGEHTKQISYLFKQQDYNTNELTVLKTKEGMRDPGNLAEQKSNKLTNTGNILVAIGLLTSLALGVISLLNS